MIAFYRDIAPRLKVTWIYNGDTDPCVSYEGTRTAVKRIGYNELDGGSYRPWFYNMTGANLAVLAVKAPLFGPNLVTQDMGAQLGGEVVNYENGLAFLTFHGSGHMVRSRIVYNPHRLLQKPTDNVRTHSCERSLDIPQVPQFRPQAALHMLDRLVHYADLSPSWPNNATLSKMSEKAFKEAMDQWTESAMTAPYVTRTAWDPASHRHQTAASEAS